MYIAVEGCCHGELDKIYDTLKFIESKENIKVDILLCCGDFQSVRDEADLKCMACPDKYKSMQDFWRYYNGDKKAPILTVFIGGNHEASNHLQELPFGGWVAPNIYYLGYAGVVNFGGVRIGGLSGIYKIHDYYKDHYECPPYNRGSQRSVYHIRKQDVNKLKIIKSPIDIVMSHDWPNGIVDHGDKEKLLKTKPYFRKDLDNGLLGSDPAWELLTTLKPTYWFSGHMHVKFAAVVTHKAEASEETKTTKFLSLDKCLPRRNFLQLLDIPVNDNANKSLSYDKEWLAILKSNSKLNTSHGVTEFEINEILEIFDNDLKIPLNFSVINSSLYEESKHNRNKPVILNTNPQTVEFCKKLGVIDPMTSVSPTNDKLNDSVNASSFLSDYSTNNSAVLTTSINEDEIDINSESDEEILKTESSKASDSFDEDVCIKNPLALNLSQILPPVKNTLTPQKCGSQGSSDGMSSLPFSPMSISSESSECKSDNDALVPGSLAAIIQNARDAYLTSLNERNKVCENEVKIETAVQPPLSSTPIGNTSTKRKTFKRRNEQFYSSQSEDD